MSSDWHRGFPHLLFHEVHLAPVRTAIMAVAGDLSVEDLTGSTPRIGCGSQSRGLCASGPSTAGGGEEEAGA